MRYPVALADHHESGAVIRVIQSHPDLVFDFQYYDGDIALGEIKS